MVRIKNERVMRVARPGPDREIAYRRRLQISLRALRHRKAKRSPDSGGVEQARAAVDNVRIPWQMTCFVFSQPIDILYDLQYAKL